MEQNQRMLNIKFMPRFIYKFKQNHRAQQKLYNMHLQPLQPEPQFLEEAVQNSLLKRKASKRIKKIANSIYKTKTQVTKVAREQDQNKIINILSDRNVPEFLIDFIKKKRIFNMSSIRKIVIKNDENAMPPTASFLSKQENDLFKIIQDDKQWKEERKRYSLNTPLLKKESMETKDSSSVDYSSFQEAPISMVDQEERGEEYPDVSMFSLMDLDEPRNLMMSRRLDDSDIFLRMF